MSERQTGSFVPADQAVSELAVYWEQNRSAPEPSTDGGLYGADNRGRAVKEIFLAVARGQISAVLRGSAGDQPFRPPAEPEEDSAAARHRWSRTVQAFDEGRFGGPLYSMNEPHFGNPNRVAVFAQILGESETDRAALSVLVNIDEFRALFIGDATDAVSGDQSPPIAKPRGRPRKDPEQIADRTLGAMTQRKDFEIERVLKDIVERNQGWILTVAREIRRACPEFEDRTASPEGAERRAVDAIVRKIPTHFPRQWIQANCGRTEASKK